jgi:hypothetical protein
VELLVAVGLIALLIGLVLVAVVRARGSAAGIECISNLRQIGAGFTQYALDHGGEFPDPFASGTSWEGLLKSYLGSAKVLRCRRDEEIFPVLGSSYDWRDTGAAETTLAGRRLAEAERADLVLAFEALPGWHARGRINVVRLDGSAESMDQEECFADLAKPIAGRVVLPERR